MTQPLPVHRPLQSLVDFNDFEIFSKALVNSNDVDPVYPFLKNIIKYEGFDPVQAVFWYGYFYSIESMVKLLRGEITFEEARYGIERARTPQVRISTNKERTLSAWKALEPAKYAQKASCSREFAEFIKQVPYFGGWVSYKYTELFEKTLGFSNLAPKDMNIAAGDVNGNGGPCGGLRWLYGIDQKYTRDVIPEWEALGVTLAHKWGFDLGEVETCLCKYRKLRAGKYFVGHDIQEFTHLHGLWTPAVFKTLMRESGFDETLFRDGFVKENKMMYKRNSVIVNAQYAEKSYVQSENC